MKKFTLVPVGECFEFQGEQYSKTGPLTAIGLSNNRQRMIPRSAMVRPLQGTEIPPEEPASEKGVDIDAAALLSAFEQYHNGCVEWLNHAKKEMSEETASQFSQALEGARQRFLDDLGISQ